VQLQAACAWKPRARGVKAAARHARRTAGRRVQDWGGAGAQELEQRIASFGRERGKHVAAAQAKLKAARTAADAAKAALTARALQAARRPRSDVHSQPA